MEEEYCFGHPTLQKHHSVKYRCLNLKEAPRIMSISNKTFHLINVT